MATIVTRFTKGSALTHTEMDANFDNLNNDKLEEEVNDLSASVTWTDVPDAYKNTNTVYAISGTTPAINPDNGMVQTWTLTGNSTPTDSLSSGQMVELHIDDGSGYTITWTMVDEWIGGSAPTLDTTNTSVIFLEKIGSTVIGRDGGVAS